MKAALLANVPAMLVAAAAIANAAWFGLNLWFSRRLALRRQALVRSERRQSGGPVTASLRERFSSEAARTLQNK